MDQELEEGEEGVQAADVDQGVGTEDGMEQLDTFSRESRTQPPRSQEGAPSQERRTQLPAAQKRRTQLPRPQERASSQERRTQLPPRPSAAACCGTAAAERRSPCPSPRRTAPDPASLVTVERACPSVIVHPVEGCDYLAADQRARCKESRECEGWRVSVSPTQTQPQGRARVKRRGPFSAFTALFQPSGSDGASSGGASSGERGRRVGLLGFLRGRKAAREGSRTRAGGPGRHQCIKV